MRIAGTLLALLLVVAVPVLVSRDYYPLTSTTVDLDHGQFLFIENCSGCHSLEPGVRNMGPNLANIGATASTRVEGQSAAQYILNSILHPDAHRHPGSAGEMPAGTLAHVGNAEIRNVVAFLSARGEAIDFDDVLSLEINQPATVGTDTIAAVDIALIERGASVFEQQGCPACHAVIAEPGHDLIAPSLAKAGQLERSYVENSILNPNKQITPGYELATVITAAGQTWSGRLVTQSEREVGVLVLDATGHYVLQRVARSNISSMNVMNISLMPPYNPAPQELRALLTYLGSIKGEAGGLM